MHSLFSNSAPLRSAMPRWQLLLVMAATLPLGACTLWHDFTRPEMSIPAAFKEGPAPGWKNAEPADGLPGGNWWEIFGDAELNALEEQVEISNQNILASEAQFRQAQALTQQYRSEYFPTVSATASSTRSKPASNNANLSNFNPQINTVYRAGLTASWEPDLWGRVRRLVEAGNAGADASLADLQAVKLSAQAEVAQYYFQLRVADANRKLLDDTVVAYERTVQLTRNQYNVGVAARADVVAAETQLKTVRAQAVDIGVVRAQLEHAIAVLIGKAPADFAIVASREPFTKLPPAIPAGIPSQLLERRPDIAAAERRAQAANAQIGVAKAAYFPALTLAPSVGYQSYSFSQLFDTPSFFWSIGPALAQTIFDGGLRKAQTAQAKAVYDQNAALYKQTILGAFQEVEDNLASLRILEQEASLQDEAVQSSRESVQITTNQYKSGIITYLDVVTVQTSALNNERTALTIQGNRLVAAVTLVKALGGGWKSSELPMLK